MNSSNSARLHPVSITFLFDPSAFRKLLNVKIIDDEEYEKNKTFTLVLEEPILLEVGQRHGELGTQLHAGIFFILSWLNMHLTPHPSPLC